MYGAMDLSFGSILASLVVSTVGFGFFLYGKKQLRMPQFIAGVVLMVFPYFVGSPLWMLGIAGGLLVGLSFAIRAGW